MMEEEINKAYVEDKPHSFGGKYRLYDVYTKKHVNKVLNKSDIYSRFKQHRRAKHCPPSTCIEKENCFSLMLYFSQEKNW